MFFSVAIYKCVTRSRIQIGSHLLSTQPQEEETGEDLWFPHSRSTIFSSLPYLPHSSPFLTAISILISSWKEERPLTRCCQPGGRASTGQMTGRHAQCTAQLYTQQHNRSRALPPLQNYRAGAAETAGAVILF